MPGQQGLRRDNGSHLSQELPSQPFASIAQLTALVVVEAHTPTELLPKNPVGSPPGDGDLHKSAKNFNFDGLRLPFCR
jgi:hypothetical protein